MSNILMVVTAAESLILADGTVHPTGFWAEELVVAHRDLTAAGHVVAIATPGGIRPTVDPGSLGDDSTWTTYLASIDDLLESPIALDTVDVSEYSAVVLPGGHGPMTDLATDESLGAILTAADQHGALIAPFCHGPAGLLSATAADGSFVFAGRRLTVFTDEEELAGGTGVKSPWFVETVLRNRGVVIDSGSPWSSHVVRDGNLISGQNPQSSVAVTAALVSALAEQN
ncbi:type 1 glutamine amidotransferase domain-containing protein [Cryobacterium sp. N22]|uniref:type 1 glutamine amidotransferase domain-containing protein n=1 Tax=Cryobacterium sp. N22 TaxID=2048290 RepID=UPI000CE4D5FC|nr:type 1 glutamine amidotransferase domain-containing protein [Cryobacterium sp. N22]